MGHRRQPSRAPRIGPRGIGPVDRSLSSLFSYNKGFSQHYLFPSHLFSHKLFNSIINCPPTPCIAFISEAMAPPEHPPSISASTRNRRQPASSSTSQTQTETNAAPHPRIAIPVGTLRLRATAAPNDTRVRWAEDVIDNEGLGRKRSKGWSLELPQLSV